MNSFEHYFELSQRNEKGCLIWAGRFNRQGYGRIGDDLAHRRAYCRLLGPIPARMTVDHLCFNIACVEPSHLRLLTNSENAQNQRSAIKPECVNGHPFDAENTYARPNGGKRQCRACNRAAVARYKQRNAA